MVAVRIEMKDPEAVYRQGDVIQGNVTLSLASSTKLQTVELKFIGEASTRWLQEKHLYSACVEYFRESRPLVSFDSWSNMPAGNYEYPFTFTIPTTITNPDHPAGKPLPPSFEGTLQQDGHVCASNEEQNCVCSGIDMAGACLADFRAVLTPPGRSFSVPLAVPVFVP